jgi:N6-adenosine-specific RNA methylase IME4
MPHTRVRNQARIVRPELLELAPAESLLAYAEDTRYRTIYADPPWRFQNRTGKMAPEHRRLSRYATMTLEDIMELPVATIAHEQSHLYLWVPNALLAEGLETMKRWGFTYKSNIVWYKIRKDNGPDGRGVGFYFRNVTELLLFGIRGKNNRTLQPGRRQVNLLATRKREHSRKPDEMLPIIEACSPGPRLEMFARYYRYGWHQWGDQVEAPPLRLVESPPAKIVTSARRRIVRP